MKASFPTQRLFNLPFFNGTGSSAVEAIAAFSSSPLTVATPNPEQIVQAEEDEFFAQVLRQFDLHLPDGQGIIWASWLLGAPLKQRITGVDVIARLLKESQAKKWRVLLIGSQDLPGSSLPDKQGVRSLSVQGSVISWWPEVNSADFPSEEKVNQILHEVKPELVFVALGAPWQEFFIQQFKKVMAKQQVKVAMVAGGAFDFLSGKVKRAPGLIQKLHLEFLYRLWQEPWRWKRQLRLVRFMGLVGKRKKLVVKS